MPADDYRVHKLAMKQVFAQPLASAAAPAKAAATDPLPRFQRRNGHTGNGWGTAGSGCLRKPHM
jgi:hypothetical protein